MKIQAFDFSINVLRALLWRHNNAEDLEALLQNKQDELDRLNNDFWNDWIVDVFDLRTANDFGLSVWSIILNLPLSIESEGPATDNSNWGFGEFRFNFNNGNFTNHLNTITLDTEQARLLLRLRYYNLIIRPTVTQINAVLLELFGDQGNAFVIDGLNMTQRYIFQFQLDPKIQLYFNRFDILPRPSTVGSDFFILANIAWGFGEFRRNFNNENFRA